MRLTACALRTSVSSLLLHILLLMLLRRDVRFVTSLALHRHVASFAVVLLLLRARGAAMRCLIAYSAHVLEVARIIISLLAATLVVPPVARLLRLMRGMSCRTTTGTRVLLVLAADASSVAARVVLTPDAPIVAACVVLAPNALPVVVFAVLGLVAVVQTRMVSTTVLAAMQEGTRVSVLAESAVVMRTRHGSEVGRLRVRSSIRHGGCRREGCRCGIPRR